MDSAAGDRLNELLCGAGLAPVGAEQAAQLDEYLSLFVRWNARTNLSSVRDEEGILSRHFLESIVCAWAVPEGTWTLLDFGSGGGFPGIPIAICRPEISVTLAESQGKKAAFLQEAVRVLGLSAKVYANRAEVLETEFDCVTLRAVDRMAEAVSVATRLARSGGRLAVMTTVGELASLRVAAGAGISWGEVLQLPGGEERIIALGERMVSSLA